MCPPHVQEPILVFVLLSSGDFGAGIEARAGDVCSLAHIGGNWGTRRSYKWAYGRKFGLGWGMDREYSCRPDLFVYLNVIFPSLRNLEDEGHQASSWVP